MATVKVGYPSFDSWIGYAEETTFGTAIAAGQDFTKYKLLDNNVPPFVPDQYLDDVIKNQEKNMSDINDYYKTENGMWRRYALPEIIASSGDLAHLLYGVCQTVTEGVADPYVKTFTMDGTTKPDFSSNAGYFFTTIIREPFASYSRSIASCVVENLTININYDNGGRLTASAGILSGRVHAAITPSGTNAFSTTSVPNVHNTNTFTLSINSQDCIVYSVTFNIQTVYDWVGTSSGLAENYAIISQKVTGTAQVKYDSNTESFLTAKGTSLGLFNLDVDTNTVAPFFAFDCNDSFLRNVSVDRGGTDTVQKLNLEFDFLNDYANTQYCVFQVADGVDRTW